MNQNCTLMKALLLSPSLLPSTFQEYENSHWPLNAYRGKEERRSRQGIADLSGNPAFTGEPIFANKGGILSEEHPR